MEANVVDAIGTMRRSAQRTLSAVLVALLFTSFGFPAATHAQESTANTTQTTTTTAADPKDAAKTSEPADKTATPAVGIGTTDTASLNQEPAATAPAKTVEVAPAATEPSVTTKSAETQATATETTPATTTAATPATQTTKVQNNVDSTVKSGNAAVLNNDDAGDATSGRADVTATVVNVVSSSNGLGAGGTHTTFTKDIVGDVQGNIIIDPATLKPVDGSSTTTLANPTQNSASLIDIENNVTLNAVSGNADVLNNDDAGNATTGDATALANIINIVSSSIGAQNSFLGVINIYGNLKGDILVPASFVDSLFASNGTSSSTSTTTAGAAGSTTSTINIANNIDLNALSGNATVKDNDDAGNATSGNAMTNLTVFNLTGQEVIAKNSLLVFVNVMGKWVGIIVNAPAGSTAAALGGDLSSGNSPAIAGDHESTVNIRNNVSVSATSGNATVAGNDDAGDATSGNATAGANVLNLVHTSFSLNDWFGVLFINVLGSWLGNFGILEPETPDTGGNGGETPNTNTGAIPDGAVQEVRVFQFSAATNFQPAPTAGDDSEGVAAAASMETPTQGTTEPAGQVLADNAPYNSLPQLPQALAGLDVLPIIAFGAGMLLLLTLAGIAIRRYRAAAHSVAT